MALSGVYTVCLTFSLLWETQIVHTKLGNKIMKFIILTISSMDQMDMYSIQSTQKNCVTDF